MEGVNGNNPAPSSGNEGNHRSHKISHTLKSCLPHRPPIDDNSGLKVLPHRPPTDENPLLNEGTGITNTQQWSTGLLHCCHEEAENDLMTMCFPCVTFGRIAEMVDRGQSSRARRGCLYALLSFIAMPCFLSCGYRSKLRNQYGLVETSCPDWIIHCFCECCALCQEYRELTARGLNPNIGWLANEAAKHQSMNAGSIAMSPPMQPATMGR